jgi:hypothetical protein
MLRMLASHIKLQSDNRSAAKGSRLRVKRARLAGNKHVRSGGAAVAQGGREERSLCAQQQRLVGECISQHSRHQAQQATCLQDAHIVSDQCVCELQGRQRHLDAHPFHICEAPLIGEITLLSAAAVTCLCCLLPPRAEETRALEP